MLKHLLFYIFYFDTHFHNSFPLADASKLRHSEPRLNAVLAALTAASTSALSPSATCAIGFPVAGFSVANVLPETASTNSLLMKTYNSIRRNEKNIIYHSHVSPRSPLYCDSFYLGVLDFLVWICHIELSFHFAT